MIPKDYLDEIVAAKWNGIQLVSAPNRRDITSGALFFVSNSVSSRAESFFFLKVLPIEEDDADDFFALSLSKHNTNADPFDLEWTSDASEHLMVSGFNKNIKSRKVEIRSETRLVDLRETEVITEITLSYFTHASSIQKGFSIASDQANPFRLLVRSGDMQVGLEGQNQL